MPAFSTLWWWLEDQMGQHVFKSCELFASCVVWFSAGLQVFPLCLLVESSSHLLLGYNSIPVHRLSAKLPRCGIRDWWHRVTAGCIPGSHPSHFP